MAKTRWTRREVVELLAVDDTWVKHLTTAGAFRVVGDDQEVGRGRTRYYDFKELQVIAAVAALVDGIPLSTQTIRQCAAAIRTLDMPVERWGNKLVRSYVVVTYDSAGRCTASAIDMFSAARRAVRQLVAILDIHQPRRGLFVDVTDAWRPLLDVV